MTLAFALRKRAASAAMLFVLAVCAAQAAAAQPASFSGQCANGAPARAEKYCRFFEYFETRAKPLDSRIAENLGITAADQTRAIALIVAIAKYPNVPGGDVSAAAADADNLKKVLIENQKFDEVIVLRDADATSANISYFLSDYLVNRARDFAKKARLVIAYSGHGRGDLPGEKAAFLLSDISDIHGSDAIFPMTFFGDYVQALAPEYFHVLTLINACYGGGFFVGGSSGGNPNKVTLPGSYAITAGPKEDQVPALNPKRGSLFFDLLVDGVARGVADTSYYEFFPTLDKDGNNLRTNGLIRTSSLNNYLTSAYDSIDRLRPSRDPGFRPLVSTWIGPAQQGVARGGFFFLADRQIGAPTDLAAAYGKGGDQTFRIAENPPATQTFSIPAGPVSSVVGKPDIKIFKRPELYPIQGFDVSSADGDIDWKTFLAATKPRFIYTRAIGWRGPDKTFRDRWKLLGGAGVDRGAYVKFSFCQPASDQAKAFKAMLGDDFGELPIGVELVTPSDDQDRAQGVHEVDCYGRVGLEKAKDAILTFASQIGEMSRRTPLLFGNQYNLSVLTDARSDRFMIWLGAYGAAGAKLKGRNPWTLWQYSGSLAIPGIGPQTTGDVFFGTEAQYQQFKSGKENVGLAAVTKEF